jgi:plastocyanin
VGPVLNRQDKLFAHLNPDYLRNILEVGGRYACGDPNSIMPIWSNTGQPAGPLNYKQVEDLINFLRAEQGEEYRVMNPELWEPVINETTGEEETFQGWVDPDWLPEPGSTPYPACWQDEFTGGGSATPAPSGGAETPAPSAAPGGTVVDISAINIAFEQTDVSAPADTAFTIRFDNKEAVPHNVEIKDASGTSLFKGEIVTGPVVVDYQVPALGAGTYQFVCTVHPNMVGTLTVGG